MNLRVVVSETHKMHFWMCIVLMLYVDGTVSWYEGDAICDISLVGCNTSSDVENYTADESQRCSMNDVTDVNIDIVTDDGSIQPGKVDVKFRVPNVECKFEVALLVNPSITNTEDCNNYVFMAGDATNETHTHGMHVCVLPPNNSASIDNCQDPIVIRYTNVFPGCYAVRFAINYTNNAVRGNKIIRDNKYNRTEVTPPNLFECSYLDVHDPELSEDLLTFKLKFLVHPSIEHMHLMFSTQSLSETKENPCDVIPSALYEWDIFTFKDDLIKYCFLNERYEEPENQKTGIDCVLELNVSRKQVYCFELVYYDHRCDRQTIWKPPPYINGLDIWPACTWTQQCTSAHNKTYEVVQTTNDEINSYHEFLLPIAITVIVIILLVIIFCACRSYSRHSGQGMYVNANLKDLEISTHPSEVDSVETTDDEAIRGSNNDDECDAIILLYARGSPTFMSLMSDFREILKNYCSCHVHDWYAASEWDAVATVGPSEWVADLLRKKHRTVWIDTPKARSLFDMQRTNIRNNATKQPYERCFDEEAISDFRDIALPVVIDFAKRNVTPQPALQYSRHFVVRLEGFDAAANSSNDPFEDFSPHTRYLIPHHLSELCSHISPWRTIIDTQHLKTDEAQFRERLIQLKTNNETG